MPTFFPRYLLFPSSPPTSPTSPSSSSQMWDRPSTNNPIFAATRASRPDSMMWSRPGNSQPIYEEPVPIPAKNQMWRRSGIAAAPMCPCCTTGNNAYHNRQPEKQRSGSMDTIASGESTPTSPASAQAPRLLTQSARRPSMGLRLRKSFASLRSRASRSTMRE